MTEPRIPLDQVGQDTANLLRGTAEDLWDISSTILVTGRVCADDWELARRTLSHALAALNAPPVRRTGLDRMAAHQAGKPPQAAM